MMSKKEIRRLYRKRAKYYNVTANFYYLFGFREYAYRKKSVKKLQLKRGDTVIEIGCGTGINFPMLEKCVGPEGRIIGVDLTDAMLEMAKMRVKKNGWRNIELVHSDAAIFEFPPDIDGVISMFALTLIPEFDAVIEQGCRALKPGKHWVILDLKEPSTGLAKLEPLFILLTRPFGVTKDLASRHPWESVEKYMQDTSFEELFWGFSYISSGVKSIESC